MGNDEIFRKYSLDVKEVSPGIYRVLNPEEHSINIYDFEFEFNDCCVYAVTKIGSSYGFIYLILIGNTDEDIFDHETQILDSKGIDGTLVGGGDKESVRRNNIPSLSGITYGENYYE